MKKFYDRGREMTELKELQAQAYNDYSRFVVLTGRRRVGKTSLVYRLISETRDDAPGLYFFVGRKTEAVLVRTFVQEVREKLGLNAHMMELPIGLEDKLEGVVDLVAMKAIYFDGPNGEDLRIAEIPANMQADAEKYREELLDAASMFDDSLMEAIME